MNKKPTYQEVEQRIRHLVRHLEQELAKLDEEDKEARERYIALFDRSLFSVFVHDLDGNFLDANDAALALSGYTREEIASVNIASILDENQWSSALEVMEEIVRTGSQHKPAEYKVRRKDGRFVWVETEGSIICRKGKPFAIQGIARDITARKRAEEALRESEERYRSLFEESPIALWEVDFSYPKRYIDQLRDKEIVDFRTHFKDNPKELSNCIKNTKIIDINKATVNLYNARSKKEFLDALRKVMAKGYLGEFVEQVIALTEGKTVFERELETQNFEGENKHIQYKCLVAPGHEKTFSKVLVSIVDITDRKRMEEEVLKMEKLESLGILAGGIAHDFNNILTPILSNISMVRIYGKLGTEMVEILTDAEKATLRAKSLIQQLLTFSKGGAPIKRIASIQELLRDSSKLALSGSKVRCEYLLPEDLWTVEMDEGQIGQVINNLVINADQASPGGGTIRISAENVVVGQKDCLPLQGDKYVRISIADSGIGIPKKHLSKIFDPFYTTKVNGSGLGLSTSFTIIKRHEGTIRVKSKVGVGTTFEIYLPASEEAFVIEEKRWEEVKTGQGRILLVDDDETVRKSTETILKRLGYEVKFTEDGAEGIRVYEEAMTEKRPFDVVIMDLTIPGGMGGKEALKRLKEKDPGARVIVSSGYSADPVLQDFVGYGFSGAVRKPYSIEHLAEVVHEVVMVGDG